MTDVREWETRPRELFPLKALDRRRAIDYWRSFVKYLLFYEPVEDVLSKAPAHFAAHSARLDDFHARGTLLMVGTFADPQEGSMAIFTTREAAEEFVADDPFVLNGVIRSWQIREWDEVLASG